MSWPTSDDVLAAATAAGFTLASVDAAAQLDAAVAEWERLTGWQPFLGATADDEPVLATRAFDPPEWGTVLPLRTGLLSIESVTVGVSPESSGTELAATGYEGLPVLGSPFTEIRFRSAWGGGPGSVRIEGWWGYCSAVPADAYDAVLNRAAALAVEAEIPGVSSGGFAQGSLRVDGGVLTSWARRFHATAQTYTRIDL